MNRVFWGTWGVLAIVTMVLDVINMVNHFTWVKFFGALFQLILIVFISRQYWKLDREAARKRRQTVRRRRFAEKFERRDHPYKMPKVGWKARRKAWREDPNNWSV